jgi:trimethylguanosine synthase
MPHLHNAHPLQMKFSSFFCVFMLLICVTAIIPTHCTASLGVEDKYWDQRYRLFSLYDRGVQMDSESWFSVTPECISEQIADRCLEGAMRSYLRMMEPNLTTKFTGKKKKKKESKERANLMKGAAHIRVGRMLDLFCGCGGNSIPLARVCDHLVAVDINPAKLIDAR